MWPEPYSERRRRIVTVGDQIRTKADLGRIGHAQGFLADGSVIIRWEGGEVTTEKDWQVVQ